MNEILSYAVTLLVSATLAWAATRWWYVRRIGRLQRELKRAAGAQHSAARMMGQARKQVEELQRAMEELRRRHQFVPLPTRAGLQPGTEVDDKGPPVRPGGWADTLPM
jgi:hypothetical protein